jgi:CDP-2,3-bis-(O-geranylgeranyl)-sn-glycerol synthase
MAIAFENSDLVAFIVLIGQAIWFILPAYFANSSPVVFGKIFKGRWPIDFGKRLKDGEPVFGPGKTWPGFFGGLAIGTVIGILQGNFLVGLLLSFGALTGDLVKSFFKRRMRIQRGKSWPLIDQWDFLIGALLLVSLVGRPSLETIIILLVLTPLIHLGANTIAYLLKLKKEWY